MSSNNSCSGWMNVLLILFHSKFLLFPLLWKCLCTGYWETRSQGLRQQQQPDTTAAMLGVDTSGSILAVETQASTQLACDLPFSVCLELKKGGSGHHKEGQMGFSHQELTHLAVCWRLKPSPKQMLLFDAADLSLLLMPSDIQPTFYHSRSQGLAAKCLLLPAEEVSQRAMKKFLRRSSYCFSVPPAWILGEASKNSRLSSKRKPNSKSLELCPHAF